MGQPTWKLLIIACIICLVLGYFIGKGVAEKKAMEKIEEVRASRRESDLIAQKAVLMGERAGEELKKAMEELSVIFAWNESIIVE